MANKNFSSESMDSLLDTLTGTVDNSTNKETSSRGESFSPSPREQKKVKNNKEHVSTTVDPDIMSKLRIIAHTHNISITDLVEKALSIVIAGYESKHGPILLRTRKKGDVNEILGI